MNFDAIILAAGKGKRFKSTKPKVLHEILEKPMLWYVIKAAKEAGANEVVVVIGHGKEQVEESLRREFPEVKAVYQDRQLGTGHAVMQCSDLLKDYSGRIVVLNGDMPLLKPNDILRIVSVDADMVLATMDLKNSAGYGRIIRNGEDVLRIIEEKDATDEEKRIREVNAGLYAFDAKKLFDALKHLGNKNKQNEYYLTDVLSIFREKGYDVKAVKCEPEYLIGVNDRHQLSVAEDSMRMEVIKKLMKNGVAFHNPKSCFISVDAKIGKDTEIFGPVYIEGETVIGENCYIGPFSTIKDTVLSDDVRVESHCWIDGAELSSGSSVGPFAKLRKKTVLDEGAKVGSFVETKKAFLGKNVKANHLTYLGDCAIGENTNIGAGTVTCNYDGFSKWQTEIGKNVFVGSNTLFVAPVKVGDKAITAAGSVITKDVPENALAVARSRQMNYEERAEVVKEKARKRRKGF